MTPTQEAILENIDRIIIKIYRQLELKPEDSNLLDLVSYLETLLQNLNSEMG